MDQPVDYISGLGGLRNIPGTLENQEATQALHTTELQQQAATLQLQQQQTAQHRAQQFQHDMVTLGDDPAPNAIAGMIRRYPEFAKQLKDAHDVQDQAKRDSDFRTQAQVWSAANSGRYDLAAQLLQAHQDASVAADEAADPTDTAIIEALKSGDPAEQKRAQSMIGLSVAAINPDKFNETYKTFNPTSAHTFAQLGSGGIFDTSTGQVTREPTDKGELREIKVKDPTTGEEITQFVRVGGGSEQGSAGGPSSSLNNPGAIRFDPANKWQGQVGNSGGFVQFDTPENGARAHQKLIANQIKAGYDTPQAWAEHYAPATDGNDPAAYAQTVASGLGIGVNDKIPLSAVPKMAALSAQVESMGTPTRGGSNAPGVVASYVTQAAGNGATPGNPNLTGDAYVASLPNGIKQRVQAILDTRAPYPTSARNSTEQAIKNAVNQADPTFDAATWKRRADTISDYRPGGKVGQSMISAATLINHIYDLTKASQQLPDHFFAFQNSLSQAGASLVNSPWLIKYNEGRKFVSAELPKYLTGKAPTQSEVEENYSSYSPSKGKGGIQSALETDIDYLFGRYDPLVQAYKDNTGKEFNIDNIQPGQQTKAKVAALAYYKENGALPTVVKSPAEAAKLPPGSIFVTPDGQIRTRH